MMGSRYQCSAATQYKLLDAVMKLAREKNYDTITVQEICSAAGVSTGSFYHQFGSKDGLVRRAYQSIDWLLTGELIGKCDRLPPLEALDHLLCLYVDYIRDEVGPILSQYYKALLSTPGPRYDLDRPYCREIRKILTRAMDQHLITRRYHPEYLTGSIMGMVRGLLFDWIIQGMDYDLADRYRLEFEIFVRGLAPSDRERGPQ